MIGETHSLSVMIKNSLAYNQIEIDAVTTMNIITQKMECYETLIALYCLILLQETFINLKESHETPLNMYIDNMVPQKHKWNRLARNSTESREMHWWKQL